MMESLLNHKEEQFFLDNFNVDRIFYTIGRADYLFLYHIKRCETQSKLGKRVYLSVLADTMNLPIPQISKAVENLRNKGYVSWKTDSEAGKTYVKLTSKAVELMRDERERMENSYKRILEEIGEEELERTIRTMRTITGILKEMAAEPEEDQS